MYGDPLPNRQIYKSANIAQLPNLIPANISGYMVF